MFTLQKSLAVRTFNIFKTIPNNATDKLIVQKNKHKNTTTCLFATKTIINNI